LLNIGDLSIVLVEPSTPQLKLILRHLAEEGAYQVTGAGSGRQALELMERYPPDLVISAMYLPDMTATELVRAMRERPDLEQAAFMLVSSETDFRALEPLRQAGIIAILPKPFGHEELRRALRSTVDYIEPSEIEIDPSDLDGLRVLVVDDSLTARKHISRVLNNLGIQRITTAENGLEAVDLFGQHIFDLVVTDLNMPNMDGRALVDHIRKQPGGESLPVLMVTSETDEARLAQVEQCGVTGIFDKPFDLQQIKDILYRVLKA
jgi:two-component system chemotaxis response regulator CheY